ncbi:MAG: alpha/beta hydrolase [Nocardioidaceae bacterium]
MTTRPLPFFSDGYRLDADLHLPDDGGAGAPYPTVVAASGYAGLKVIHPERFARNLNSRGYAVLAFDYRGFGLSEGQRGRLVPQEWALDLRAAVDRVSCQHDLDAERIALVGWGLGGGVVVSEAHDDPRVKAVVCCNGLADGYRSTKNMHDEDTWRSLLARIEADRERRTTLGRSEITSPWDIVRLDRDGTTEGYVDEQLYRAPGFGTGVGLESAERLLRFRPEREVADLSPRPIMIVHGTENRLYKVEEAYAMYAAAREPKRLELLDGKGHTEWMFDDDPTFLDMMGRIDDFLSMSLHPTASESALMSTR